MVGTMNKIKIFIVSKYSVIRRGLRDLLKKKSDYICIGERDDHKVALIAREAKVLSAQILILDLAFVSEPLEANLIQQIKNNSPLVKIIVLTPPDKGIYYILENQAAGYVLITEIEEELIRAIKSVAQDRYYYSPQITDKMAQIMHLFKNDDLTPKPLSLLTKREQQIFTIQNQGMSTRQIADHLNLAQSTVRCHIRNIKNKLRQFDFD